MTEVLTNSGLQLALLLLVSPLLSGIIKSLKAKLQTRRGPSIFLTYWDVFKLLRKGMVIPETASWIFSAAPYIVFGTATLVGLMIPMTTTHAPLSLFGGVLAVVYLLALGRFFLALGGDYVLGSARVVLQQAPVTKAERSSDELARAKDLFAGKCARCHGANGRGQTVQGEMLGKGQAEQPYFGGKRWDRLILPGNRGK